MSELKNDKQDDFVWRFSLNEKPLNPTYNDPLLEMIRVQWEELLKLCTPFSDGERIRNIDGFSLMRDPDKVYQIYSRDDSLESNE